MNAPRPKGVADAFTTIEAIGRSAPRILFMTSSRWASDVNLPRVLRVSGASVAMLCPPRHPARAARLDAFFDASPVRPLRSLSRAVAAFSPDLLVPGDERTRRVMHRLHGAGSARERALVEASLGSPDAFGLLLSRQASMAAVARAGMPTPELFDDVSSATLASLFRSGRGPIVLKADGTWAGDGVRIARSPAEADQACAALRKGSLRTALKRWLVNRDGWWLADQITGTRRSLSAQSYVPGGRVGDLALFCRDGEVLASVAAEREVGSAELGPSTIVRIVDRPSLKEGARRFVRALGLSGFIGFDFMVDPATGEALVIEVNPRATALASVTSPNGLSPAFAAVRSFGGVPDGPMPAGRELVAYFPKAWVSNPDDVRLALCAEDIPAEEPELVSALLGTPWGEGGWRVVLWNAVSAALHDLRQAREGATRRRSRFRPLLQPRRSRSPDGGRLPSPFVSLGETRELPNPARRS